MQSLQNAFVCLSLREEQVWVNCGGQAGALNAPLDRCSISYKRSLTLILPAEEAFVRSAAAAALSEWSHPSGWICSSWFTEHIIYRTGKIGDALRCIWRRFKVCKMEDRYLFCSVHEYNLWWSENALSTLLLESKFKKKKRSYVSWHELVWQPSVNEHQHNDVNIHIQQFALNF